MKRNRMTAVCLAAASLLLVSACGGSGDGTSSAQGQPSASGKVAFLLPESKTAQYETQDRPWFFKNMEQLCPDCEVLYSNAEQDAQRQQQQAEAALVNGAKVLVLDPVDSKSAAAIAAQAHSRNVPVIAYDRLILDADIDYYVSFDNEAVGALQGKWLVENTEPASTIVMINGSPTDNNAGLFKSGAHQQIDASDLVIGREYDTPDWSPDKAQREMEQAITALGASAIGGVYAANDGTAGGAIAAMVAAGVNPLPPVTGQDAEVAGLQRILVGTQGMTVYRSIKQQSMAAVQLAVALLRGEEPPADLEFTEVDNGFEQVPSVLFTPVAVTKDNLAETVVADGYWTAEDICTAEYADACDQAGIK
ncbi:sugar ABC transporter substrate-binding protein [Nocardioides sp.]|uniref:ABC transporter substrate-binding protein n=1 Tax=Nocardioides sp. TaxID=35761 RepID=UPI002EDB47D7